MKSAIMFVKCCAAVLLLVGCSHQFEMLNRSDYAVEKVHDDRHSGLNVALLHEQYQISDPDDNIAVSEYKMAKTPIPVEKSFLQALAKSLCEQGGYKAFVTSDPGEAGRADVTIRVSEQVSGEGCGKNFWICFPGCVVYAPAWNGYAYNVNWRFGVSIEDLDKGLSVGRLVLDRKMDVRYATPGDDEMSPGNYLLAHLWVTAPLGLILVFTEAGINANTYYDGTTFAARKVGILDVFADGMAQEIIAKINAAYIPKKELAKHQAIDGLPTKMGSGTLNKDRLRDLESLKAAGVISEEEYRREVERLKSGGSGKVESE